MSDAPAEVVDPLQDVVNSHLATMKEITATGLNKSQQLCDESLLGIKRHAGLRTQLVNQALENLGITLPTTATT